MNKIAITLVVSTTLLTGCTSQPNVYYTLTANESVSLASQHDIAPSTLPGLYTLSSVTVPPPVDDSMLVVRRSDDQLMKLAHDRWSAPLGRQVGNALSVALTQILGMPPLARAQAAGKDEKVTKMSVDIQRFDMVPGQFAALSVAWQITPAGSSRIDQRLTCYTHLSQPVEPGVAPLVKAQQQNIVLLAQAMARAWQTGQQPASTRCQ